MTALQFVSSSYTDEKTKHMCASIKIRVWKLYSDMTTKKPSGRSHGFKHKSRSIMTKKAPRGVSFLLREYHEGDKAVVIIDPRQHKGLPHRRYHGKVGTINKVGRRSVILGVKLGNKTKTLITRFDHIKPFGV